MLLLGQAGLAIVFLDLVEPVEIFLQHPLLVKAQDKGMDVIFPTYRPRVPEELGHLVDRFHDDLLLRGGGFVPSKLFQGPESVHGAAPGAEILRREIFPAYLPNVLVYHAGVHRLPLALFIVILEQLLARDLLALLHDPRQLGILQADILVNPLLAFERKPKRATLYIDVLVLEGREAKRAATHEG